MFWMDDTSWKRRAWNLTKSLFFKTENNSSRFYKARINSLSWSYVMAHGVSKLFEKNFCVTIQLNCCPLKFQASCMTQIHRVRFINVKKIISRTTDILTFISIFRTHALLNLMVRKPPSFIQNTYFSIL